MTPVTLDNVAVALGFISADCDRDTWVRVGMSIKSEFGEGGFSVFDNWSATADCYKEKDTLTTWKSIRAGGATGIGSLIHMAKQNGYTYTVTELTTEQKNKQEQELNQRREQRGREQEIEKKTCDCLA